MVCKDKSTNYLKGLGYNVIRHPRQGVVPYGVIGVKGKAVNYLGHLQFLLENPPAEFAAVATNIAGDINGQKSDSMKLKVGLNILGNIIGAMGGNLGITASYTNATKVQFSFKDVSRDSISILQLGSAIKDSTIDIENPAIAPYLENGELFLITAIIKSDKIGVDYQNDSGVGVDVDIPVIKEVVGGNIAVESSAASTSKITYRGNLKLPFGFVAYRVGLDSQDGTITLEPTAPGSALLTMSDAVEEGLNAVIFSEDGFVDL